jgi:phosphatidylinositol-3,4,5-trisphosphate 3-phosphatase/dual-specificity protein phosphatase PTEN
LQIEPFCENVKKFLDGDAARIVAIHCKAGKGRTGFLIACYLRYCGFSPSAEHALRYFAVKRTYDGKGVTIPSQITYCLRAFVLAAACFDGR